MALTDAPVPDGDGGHDSGHDGQARRDVHDHRLDYDRHPGRAGHDRLDRGPAPERGRPAPEEASA